MSDVPGDAQLLECGLQAARAAGDHALRNVDRRGEALSRSHHDVKLALDVECQRLAAECIRSSFPDHAFLGEEDDGGETTTESEFTWIVDPIDGTVNYSHGLPFWCCSVAVRRRGTMRAGTVYAPALEETYTATLSGPALLNGDRLRVSQVDSLENAIVMTGLDHKCPDRDVPSLAIMRALSERVQRPRVMGSAALDLCRVARGHADAYIETCIYVWDIAAAGLIVRRAGGKTEILEQRSGNSLTYLASNAGLHAEMKALVTAAETA